MSDIAQPTNVFEKAAAKSATRGNVRLFLEVVNGSKLFLTIGFSCILASSFFLVNGSVLLGKICASLGALSQLSPGEQQKLWDPLYQMIAVFLALEVASVGVQFLGRTFLAKGTTHALMELRRMLFVKLSHLPMTYFDTQPMGRIITRLTNDVEGVEGFFGGGLARIVTACVQVILVLAGILTIAPHFGVYIVCAAIPSLAFSWFTRKPVHYWLKENKSRNAHLNSTFAEFIQGLPVLRILGLESWSGDVISRDAKNYLDSSIKVLTWNSFIRPVTVFLSVMPTLVTALLGGWFLMHGQVELAVLVAVLRLTERFSSPVRVLTQEIQVIQDALTSSGRVKEMLLENEERKFEVSREKSPSSSSVVGNIDFEDVFLAYRPGVDVLASFHLSIPAGQKLGIVGATGAGKSSILNLIPGLYQPHKGRVLIDGKSLNDWNLEEVRSQIGYLAQDPFLFKGTLGQNILGVGCDHVAENQKRFLELMEELGLSDVLLRYPGGLNFSINENGSNLSSGEKQMITFMRMMYEDRPILLMDEATSCLDRKWESAIQKAILGLMKHRKRTCVIIAHRLETLMSCDRVIRIEGGALIEDGSPEHCLIRN